MSLAIKYNESGPQMQTYHAPNRFTKHSSLFEILKLTIMSEQRQVLISSSNQATQINSVILQKEGLIFESLDWRLDFHTGYEISNVFLLSTINHIT